jgi:hypothetical protein
MEDEEGLRRKIAHYRRWLAEGVDSQLAHHYFRELAVAELALRKLTGETDNDTPSPQPADGDT